MPDRYVIPRIRNIRQLRNLCGPAALASVLSYWGIEVRQEEIAAAAFCDDLQATHGADLLLYARKIGLRAYSYAGCLQDLKQKVSEGIPLIVLQISSAASASPHYRIVVGYDDRLAGLFVLDPCRDGVWRITYREFRQLWRPCGSWALLVVPGSRDRYEEPLGERNAVVHYDLATAYLRADEMDAASREMAWAHAIDPHNPVVSRALAGMRRHHPGRRSVQSFRK